MVKRCMWDIATLPKDKALEVIKKFTKDIAPLTEQMQGLSKFTEEEDNFLRIAGQSAEENLIEVLSANREVSEIRHELYLMTQSRSWKITKPLRAISGSLKK